MLLPRQVPERHRLHRFNLFHRYLTGTACTYYLLHSVTIYVQVEKKEIVSAASQGAVSGSLIALYISSIVFLLLGVAGLSGSMKGMSKKENRGTCLLGLFSIGVMVFFVVFLAGTIFFFVGPETIFGTDCTTGSKTTLIADLYKTSQEAYGIFCTSTCKCNIKDPNSYLAKTLPAEVQGTDAIKYGDCPNPVSAAENIEIMVALENILQCGGWCPLDNKVKESDPFNFYFYRFRDINDCTTEGNIITIQIA